MTKEYPWMLGPFEKAAEANPCLVPNTVSRFFCPVQEKELGWEAKDVFNPAAVVKDDRVYLLYRAEDHEGKYAGTSRIGLAVSDDGLHFTTMPEPVLYPEVALLCCAESTDLVHWEKHGPIFKDAMNGKYKNLWSKSGAVVCRQEGDHFYPVKLKETYWMYWGESDIYAATSDDLIHWTPVEFLADGADPSHSFSQHDSRCKDNDEVARVLLPIIRPRVGDYDEFLCEPGPQAILTDAGIVLIYNGKGNNPERLGGHDTMYQGGQLLIDPENPTCLIARTTRPFISPSESFELEGQVMPTCFLEGLVSFHGRYYMYYGTADSKVAVASAPQK